MSQLCPIEIPHCVKDYVTSSRRAAHQLANFDLSKLKLSASVLKGFES